MKYFDGMSGLVVLYVMLNYGSIMMMMLINNGVDFLKYMGLFFYFMYFYLLNYGIYVVVMFIVFLGYLLMLLVVWDFDMKFNGGLKGFFFSSVWWILFLYYVVMFLCFLLMINLFFMGMDSNYMVWGKLVVGFLLFGSVVLYVFMFYDFMSWYIIIDFLMWSVVIEW